MPEPEVGLQRKPALVPRQVRMVTPQNHDELIVRKQFVKKWWRWRISSPERKVQRAILKLAKQIAANWKRFYSCLRRFNRNRRHQMWQERQSGIITHCQPEVGDVARWVKILHPQASLPRSNNPCNLAGQSLCPRGRNQTTAASREKRIPCSDPQAVQRMTDSRLTERERRGRP